MIMVHVGDSREVHSRNLVLNYREVCEIRHEAVYHSSKRICIWRLRCRSIKVHDLLISRACLEKEGRSPWAAGLKIDHEADIVEELTVVLPESRHTHHSDLFRIGEENLHTLLPVLTVLEDLTYSLEDHADSVTVVSGTV